MKTRRLKKELPSCLRFVACHCEEKVNCSMAGYVNFKNNKRESVKRNMIGIVRYYNIQCIHI